VSLHSVDAWRLARALRYLHPVMRDIVIPAHKLVCRVTPFDFDHAENIGDSGCRDVRRSSGPIVAGAFGIPYGRGQDCSRGEQDSCQFPNHILLRSQIRALITMLLLKYLQLRSRFGWSLSNLVALLRMNLFTHRDLWAWLDHPFEGPPTVLTASQWVLALA
jgi:hypothetical protein